jgi:hypothetical protein
VKHEYRFNIFDNEIYQISYREKTPSITPNGGYIFNYRSLGNNAEISDKFYEFIDQIIHQFYSKVGNNVCTYTIDIMKDKRNNYYLTEINSACGIGEYTANKLKEKITESYTEGRLNKYRVR